MDRNTVEAATSNLVSSSISTSTKIRKKIERKMFLALEYKLRLLAVKFSLILFSRKRERIKKGIE